MYIELLKEMFEEMTIKKNASLIPHYYHSDFLLFTNGHSMDYQEFLTSHISYYATSIQYEVQYEDEAFVEHDEKVAGRMWISTCKSPALPFNKMEIMLVAIYKENKIYRMWELTYPDWSKLDEFKE